MCSHSKTRIIAFTLWETEREISHGDHVTNGLCSLVKLPDPLPLPLKWFIFKFSSCYEGCGWGHICTECQEGFATGKTLGLLPETKGTHLWQLFVTLSPSLFTVAYAPSGIFGPPLPVVCIVRTLNVRVWISRMSDWCAEVSQRPGWLSPSPKNRFTCYTQWRQTQSHWIHKWRLSWLIYKHGMSTHTHLCTYTHKWWALKCSEIRILRLKTGV